MMIVPGTVPLGGIVKVVGTILVPERGCVNVTYSPVACGVWIMTVPGTVPLGGMVTVVGTLLVPGRGCVMVTNGPVARGV